MKSKAFVAVAALLALGGLLGIVRSFKSMLAPAPGPSVLVEQEAEEEYTREHLVRVGRHTTWSPDTSTPGYRPSGPTGKNPLEGLDLNQISENPVDLQARQLQALRKDLAENAADEQENLPTEEDLVRMQARGDMVW